MKRGGTRKKITKKCIEKILFYFVKFSFFNFLIYFDILRFFENFITNWINFIKFSRKYFLEKNLKYWKKTYRCQIRIRICFRSLQILKKITNPERVNIRNHGDSREHNQTENSITSHFYILCTYSRLKKDLKMISSRNRSSFYTKTISNIITRVICLIAIIFSVHKNESSLVSNRESTFLLSK